MIDTKELFLDMVHGFKKIFMAIGIFLLVISLLWGALSALFTIFGAIEFWLWNVPFWVLLVCALAVCIGQED